jgi:hypothetical protein
MASGVAKMRRTKAEIMDGINAVKSKLIALNTVEYWTKDGDRVIRLHDTNIMTFKANKDIVLNSGGWLTPTTKDRINQFLPTNYRISQNKKIWYLIVGDYENNESFIFQDGITIKKSGKIARAKKSVKTTEKLLKKASQFCKDYIDKFMKGLVPLPSGGDCWHCSLKAVEDNKPLGDVVHDTTKNNHIYQHVKEKHYVPSLLYNALEEQPISILGMNVVYKIWHKEDIESIENFRDMTASQALWSLKKYIFKRLGLAT